MSRLHTSHEPHSNNPFDLITEQLSKLQLTVDLILKERELINEAPAHQQWLSVTDLMQYDPSKPARQTVYSWVHYKSIPFFKRGKRVFFRRDQIDEWLNSNRQQTAPEIEKEVSERIASKNLKSDEVKAATPVKKSRRSITKRKKP